MPPVEKHVKLSLGRTGKEYRDIHEWFDSKEVSYNERVARHNIINIPKYLPSIKKQFGEEGAKEYLYHIKEDYEHNILFRALRKIRGIRGSLKSLLQ